MPFTPTHAIAAIGLHRLAKGLPLSALVVGSMAPDFEYLIRLEPSSAVSHTLAGSVWFCVPAGLVGWGIWRFLFLPALGKEFGRGLPKGDARSFFPRELIVVLLSLWAGAMTHLVWDSFTHPGGWAVRRLPLLSEVLWRDPPVGVYKVLQHASSLLGAIGILRWLRTRAEHPVRAWLAREGSGKRLALAAVAVAAAGALGGWIDGVVLGGAGGSFLPGRFVVGAMDALVLLAVGWGLVSRWSGAQPQVPHG